MTNENGAENWIELNNKLRNSISGLIEIFIRDILYEKNKKIPLESVLSICLSAQFGAVQHFLIYLINHVCSKDGNRTEEGTLKLLKFKKDFDIVIINLLKNHFDVEVMEINTK